MPTPYAKVLVSVNGGGNTSGGIDIPSAATIALSAESTVGWTQARWEIIDYPEGFTAPAGWSTAADGTIYSTSFTPSSFTLAAASTRWGKWHFRLRVNEQVADDQNIIENLVDSTTIIHMLSPNGQRDTAAGETTQFCTSTTMVKGWVRDYQRNLRIIEPLLGGGGSGTPGGSGTQFQYRVSGTTFGGASGFDYDTGANKARFINPWLLNDSDASHQYQLAVSNLAANRTITLPLLTGNDTFVFEAHTQTLTNKTLTSPTLGGTPVFSATSLQATGNARHKIYSDIANVQTTDATVTSLFTWTILDEAVTKMVAEVNACQSTGANVAAYTRGLKFKRDGGTVTAGTVDTVYTEEDVAGWDATIDNSTSTGRVRVTGAAATTIDWGGTMTRSETAHA